jgi:hypothetical protein
MHYDRSIVPRQESHSSTGVIVTLARLSTVLALVLLAGGTTDAQTPATISFAPGVRITQAQTEAIDSIIRAQRDEGRALLARNDSLSRSVSARRRLRQKYHDAVLAALTPAQRAVYDAWYQAVEATFESKRRAGTGTP